MSKLFESKYTANFETTKNGEKYNDWSINANWYNMDYDEMHGNQIQAMMQVVNWARGGVMNSPNYDPDDDTSAVVRGVSGV